MLERFRHRISDRWNSSPEGRIAVYSVGAAILMGLLVAHHGNLRLGWPDLPDPNIPPKPTPLATAVSSRVELVYTPNPTK